LWLSYVLTRRTPLWCFRREEYLTNQKQFLKRVPRRFMPDYPTDVSMWSVPSYLLLKRLVL
jgi:hypothetical protein